jgi:hypothetical protein
MIFWRSHRSGDDPNWPWWIPLKGRGYMYLTIVNSMEGYFSQERAPPTPWLCWARFHYNLLLTTSAFLFFYFLFFILFLL